MKTKNDFNFPAQTTPRPYALVTGASQGLGRAFAEECARRRFNLILVSLPGEGLPAVAEMLSKTYAVQAEYFETDLTAPQGPEMLVNWISSYDWPVAVLINNAGCGYNKRFEDSTLTENENCILLNNYALVKITRLLLPELKRQPRAYILNVSSLAAFFPMPFMPVYAPTKVFILNFSLALREELRQTTIGISALCPNGIRTNAETREQIEAGGLMARLTCMDPAPVAAYALQKLLAGTAVIVPGALNRMIMTLGKYTPSSIIYAVIRAFWGKTARSAIRVNRSNGQNPALSPLESVAR